SLLSEYNEKDSPKTIFLQNHGVFVGADTPCEIDEIYKDIMTKLKTFCNDFDSSILKSPLKIDSILDNRLVSETAPELRTLLSPEKQKRIILSSSYFDVAEGPLTPDHIVYSCSFPLIGSCKKTDIDNFSEKRGYLPKVVCIPQKAVFTSGTSLKDAKTSMSLAKDAAYVYQLTKAFGGARFLNEREYGFIENWEVESYRKKVSENSEKQGLLQNKITIITGGAQGFGFGIAQELAKEGATIAIADINLSGAQEATQKLEDEFGKDRFLALEVDISKEDAVEKMIDNVVALTGGLDLFIANAGVLKAGPVKDFDRKNWDFVTNINYHGYFLCTKYASKIMALQNKFENSDWTDIVQINSKSGLEGSKRNAAYAGSKFGTIGLTQSFALELVQDKIKVNSICPGNFFSGPLWSNPDNGLFVQYLNSDKVPGAKTLEDVKKYYEAQIPMNRGCLPKDVAKAIFYVVGQQYETGQAIPVTGGQVMLH
ncbi:MAG: SDR family NAD(P)-dependent oxidoreductase, partial [Verrucomicrobiota bacterium]|nr:SDR family NAD(P)-dependent oxidoreductase [Verrucomicrobiota bacterium]